MSSLLHLADSGCRLMVWNLRTPFSSPPKCLSDFSVLPSWTNSSQSTHFDLTTPQSRSRNPRPDDLSKTSKFDSVAVVSQHFVRGPYVGSHVITAEDPTTVLRHPADSWVIRVQPATNPRRMLNGTRYLLLSAIAPMVAWLSTGERSSSVLCLCLACTSRRIRVTVTF